MQSCTSLGSPQWALIRRYGIIISRTPIKSFIRTILWPGITFGLALYLLSANPPTSHKNDPYSYLKSQYLQLSVSLLSSMTIFYVYWFADLLIKDKSSEMKKLMLSMGMKRFDYYCANSICLLLYVLPVSLAVAILSKLYLLDETVSWPVILLLYTLFALHLDSATSFLVSFITSPVLSAIFPVLLFFEPILQMLIVDLLANKIDGVFRRVIVVMSTISPYQPIRIFYNGYLNSHGELESKIPVLQNLSSLFIEQVIWIILMRSFAYWFEEVCPWQNVSAIMDPFFCLKRRGDRFENTEDSMENTAINSKYFEHRPHDREVGIKISGVVKAFDKVRALNDVSFSIYKGETTLLLGHNGAGKTTLMSVILGLLNPDHGKVAIKKGPGNVASVGVCPQTSILDENLNVKQHLELFNDIKSDISGLERDRHILQTIDDVSLGSHVNKQPHELSGGMKRKLSLGIAFVGKSDVLILDEPSSGLDPDSRMFIWNAIRRYRADRTVLLSTQHMEEADYLGDRIAIMSAGQIVCCGSSVYLNKLFGTGYKLRIECQPSKRDSILGVIESYFDAAEPEEGMEAPVRAAMAEANSDFVVELKMRNKSADAEVALIRLLEDIESNSSTLGIQSYGLKSSSIEDVMLNSNKYFSDTHSETATESEVILGDDHHEERLIKRQTRWNIIKALCMKQVQVYRAQWKLVLLIKLLLPVLVCYYVISGTQNVLEFWQSPVTAIMVGHFIYFPSKERASKFKIMQLESSASVWLYWLSQFIMDLLPMAICLVAVNIFVPIKLTEFFLVPELRIHQLVSLGTFLFLLASIMLCYMLSTMFSSADASFAYMVMIYAMSTALYVLSQLTHMIDTANRWKAQREFLGCIFIPFVPGDAYQYFLSGLATDCYLTQSDDPDYECRPEEGPSRVLVGLVALGVQILIYPVLLYLIESQKIDLAWYLRPRNAFSCILGKGSQEAGIMLGDTDKDVEQENRRSSLSIANSSNIEYCLTAAKLNKSYYKDTKVVKNLSFTVRKGECFGLLGVNGAGKSTTFSMLSAESPPDSGRILANGLYQDQNLQQFRSMLGYDPQSNPELSLTVYQALSLMAQLRGIDESRIPEIIKSIVDLLEMSEHINKYDSELSGGTKRKLALGMALIGNPSILMLDEPTAGVDPFARRGVWRLLRSVRTRGDVSIVISSHAMEECEAICDRISIMARGRLRCIGTFLHLRSKFAKGCSLKVQFSAKQVDDNNFDLSVDGYPSLVDSNNVPMRRQPAKSLPSGEADNLADRSTPELKRLLDAAIGPSNYKLADMNANSLTFEITENDVKRSILFKTMREYRQKNPNASYMINDSSLEDIFITLAREQQEK